MAEIKSIEIRNNKTFVSLMLSKDEYTLLKNRTSDLLLLPADLNTLSRRLTSGKLGNSNRIMVPKKMLERENIKGLDKKLPAQIFQMDDEIFLLIKLRSSETGIPKFEGD